MAPRASKPRDEAAQSADGPETPSLGGWVRVEPDAVIRGWVTDRNNRSARFWVDILIDDETIAGGFADRLDPKLVELGEGDGRYAFAMLVPEAFRDGRKHSFEARTRDADFRLKSKADAFEIGADAPLPTIELHSAGYGSAIGRVRGLKPKMKVEFELWRGDERLAEAPDLRWIGSQDDPAFLVTFPPELSSGDDLRLALPGMVEAGFDVALLTPDAALSANCDGSGLLALHLSGDLGWLDAAAVEARVYVENVFTPALVVEAAFEQGAFETLLPPALHGAALEVRLAVEGVDIPQLAAKPSFVAGPLCRNGGFHNWGPKGPERWAFPQHNIAFDRGFYAFPPRIVEQQGVVGDFVHIETDSPGVLMRQAAAGLRAGSCVKAALMVRASAPATLRLTVRDGAGDEIGSVTVSPQRAWTWAYATETFEVARDIASTDIEVSLVTGGPMEIDIVGVQVGGDRFAEDAIAESRPDAAPSANAVENARLVDWPRGVVFECRGGRNETARGWFIFNRRAQDPVRVKAMILPERDDALGFAFAAEAVPDYCRLEVRLDAAAVEPLSRAAISFEMGSPLTARTLLSEAKVGLPEFLLIDRIMLLKRSQVVGPKGFSLVDETLAVIGRKILLTRRLHPFQLQFSIAPPKSASEFEWENPEAALCEYYLVFEFRQPFAVALQNLAFGAAAPSQAVQAEGFLSLEDRNIAVQAEVTRGLELWLSPTPVRAGQGAVGQPSSPAPLRWSWSAMPSGAVEVAICVFNAVEETLACLRSLVGTTQTPHTVRIIDDGSDPDTVRRIEAFIADKPWMRLVSNPGNIGYTSSADRALRESEADWVVLLNSDTVVTSGWLEGLLEVAASDPKVAFVGPLSNAATFQSLPELYDGRNQFAINKLPAGWDAERMAALVKDLSEKAFPQVPLLNGFCTLIRRSVFLEVGGLNRTAFPAGYGEENDLCTRVAKAGYKLAIADHVYVYHTKSASFGSARRTELAKAGGKALRELHPDVDYGTLTAGFRDTPALVQLRDRVRAALAANGSA